MFSFGFVSFFVILYYPTICHGGVTIKEEECKGLVLERDNSIAILSPGFGVSYPAHSQCTYEVKYPAGKRVSLQFIYFDVAGAMPNCSEDYVEVKVGCTNTKSMGKFCSVQSLPPFHSSDGCMTIVFKSDKEGCSKGFVGHVTLSSEDEPVSSSCSKSNEYEMLSPDWPMDFSKSSTCTWTQDVNGTDEARFFFSSFNLEAKAECDSGDDSHCTDDEVIVYGVYSNGTKKALKRLCDTGEVLFDLPIAGYDKLEVKFCADNDDSVASGIAGGLVLYKNGVLGPNETCNLVAPTCPSTAVTTSSPGKGFLLIMAILSFIMSKCYYH